MQRNPRDGDPGEVGREDAWACLTPFGVAMATFPEDSRGIALSGSADAVSFVEWAISQSTDIDGISLSVERIEPGDLEQFCRVDGLTVLPPWAPPDPDADQGSAGNQA
jgi:hypothetical protein